MLHPFHGIGLLKGQLFEGAATLWHDMLPHRELDTFDRSCRCTRFLHRSLCEFLLFWTITLQRQNAAGFVLILCFQTNCAGKNLIQRK